MASPLSRSFLNDQPPVGESRGLDAVGMHDVARLMWLEMHQDELGVAVESPRVAGRRLNREAAEIVHRAARSSPRKGV
jgi:hypothetical protein